MCQLEGECKLLLTYVFGVPDTQPAARAAAGEVAPAEVMNNSNSSLFNICYIFFSGSCALVQSSGHCIVNGGSAGEPPLPQGLVLSISMEAKYFQIVSRVPLFYVAMNVEG